MGNLKENRLLTVADTFHDMRHLSYLNLFGNSLQEVPSSLTSCTKITSLLLANNRLTQLPLHLFQVLTSLRRLEVHRNQLQSMESLHTLKGLRILDLSFNLLKKLPAGLSALEHLYSSRFNNCNVSEWKEPLPKNLQILSMSKNPLTRLPEQVYTLKRLQRLDVGHLQLFELSEKICSLQHLQVLTLRETELNRLPVGLAKLKFLIELDISGNKFDQFPMEVTSLTSLRSLDASNNRFASLPVEIGKLEGLLHLDLGYNQLQQLPSFHCLRQLSQLDVSNNKLNNLHESIFTLAHLRFLYTSKNNFSKTDLRRKIKKRFCI